MGREQEKRMGQFRLHITMSLDGFVAGPDQSVENPLGVGGKDLHAWAFALSTWLRMHGAEGGVVNASSAVVEEQLADVGAVVMGRNMFGGQPGRWREPPWNGWWGENPPYHTPVFVLTHQPREPLALQGGTTFYFVTDGIEAALERAQQAAAGKDVALGGGANVAQQYLAARLLDELNISLVPRLLGSGERLFDNLASAPGLEQTRAIEAPGVTHLRYRVIK
jgi:dihydrofolate reductase